MTILKEFRYHAPADIREALALLEGAQDGLVLAGGTFVLNHLKKAGRVPSDVVALRKIAALKGIRREGTGVVVGALTTIADVAQEAVIKENFASLAQAAAQLGTTPIRNMATIGGNIASRFFWVDLPAVLASLKAELVFETRGGGRKVSVLDFLKNKPAEKFILTRIVLPLEAAHRPYRLGRVLPEKGRRTRYFRHTKAMEVDVPSLALAFSCRADGDHVGDVKFVVNTAASHPTELPGLQKFLEGKTRGRVTGKEALACLEEDLRGLALDEYRRHLLCVDVEELLAELKG